MDSTVEEKDCTVAATDGTEKKNKQVKRDSIGKMLLSFLIKMAVFGGIVYLAFTFAIGLHRTTGNNMFPMIKDGDLCLLYKLEAYNVNDVILYDGPDGKEHLGRIKAVAGQEVSIPEEGGFLVNGYEDGETVYFETKPEPEMTYPYIVQNREFFVLSDYRIVPEDSRKFGAISEDSIKGKVLAIFRRRGV